MLPPPNPENEALRLNELASYDVLDSAPESAFDDVTASIAKICGTPIALVTLLDGHRQWFKSKVGLEAPEKPRAISFCGHAILDPGRVMIVPDALADERFFDNPLVTGTPDIRFYAGTPLVTEGGHALGTLCIIDTVPRTLSAEQTEMLEMAGRMVTRLLEKRRTGKLLEIATEARRRAESTLSLVSSHDSLTQLPNRAQFLSRIQTSLERLHAGTGNRFGVFFIDIDHFKQINDTLGHMTGDALLTEVGRRLNDVKRSRDLVARLGGDEFAMFVDGLATTTCLKSVAKRIASALRPLIVIGDVETHITASTGSVFVESSYTSVEDVIRDADIAMYESKERGRNRHTVFTADLREQFTLASEMKLTLRRALDQQEFRLGYQPIVPLAHPHARPIAFEALLRWQQTDGTHITAAQFIDTAERTGMIIELGYWVLREACAQARRWQKTGGDPIVTTVNVSARQLAEPGFVLAVKRIVRDAKLDPRLLGLEVTESILIGDVESSLAIMHELRAIGIKIYLDDFGTGYSSLSYLRKFPVDRIKIDRSFVSGVDDGLADPLIVASVIALAHKMNIRVVAEGVETERQRMALKELGCDCAQGYLFSRAVPADQASLLLLITAEHLS